MLPLGDVEERLLDLRGVQRLPLHEDFGDPVQGGPVGGEDGPGLVVRPGDELADLIVDHGGDLLGVVLVPDVVAAQEHLSLGLAVLHGPQALAHAVLHDHAPRQDGDLFDVVVGPRRRIAVHDLLSGATGQPHGQVVHQLALALVGLVGQGQRAGVAAGPATRDDRHLVHRVGHGHGMAHQGMPALVDGGEPLVLVGHHPAAPLGAGHDPVHRLLELRLGDDLLAPAGGEDGRLVDGVGQIRSAEPGR